mgnify:CR=1 FL=1
MERVGESFAGRIANVPAAHESELVDSPPVHAPGFSAPLVHARDAITAMADLVDPAPGIESALLYPVGAVSESGEVSPVPKPTVNTCAPAVTGVILGLFGCELFVPVTPVGGVTSIGVV